MMLRHVLLLLVAGMLVARAASADVEHWEANYDPGPAERRSDFAAGLGIGMLLGRVSGYPNEVVKIDDPRYEANTGLAGGPGGTLWLGAALRDWIVVGIGGTYGTVAGGDGMLSEGGAVVLHLELFPLFYRGGAWRDVAVVGDFGAGGRTVFRGSKQAAEGGSVSYVSLGVLYEPFRVGKHVSAGPILQVTQEFSPTLTATLATAGIQLAFYGGPN